MCLAQTFLNGSFENNTAPSNQINISNFSFNGLMGNTNAFGTNGNMDIIQTNTWGGGFAQHCATYVALTGSGTDAFAMTLSAPLVAGNTYTISFWDRKDAGFTAFPIELGLSTLNNSFGTLIYTAPTAAATNFWTQRIFTFNAPNNGQFITVRQSAGGLQDWVHVDNFVMGNQTSSGGLTIASSATTICLGSSAVFTVTGALAYTWTPSTTLSSATGSVVTATPPVTTIYSVTGNSGGCILTGSIALNVIPSPSISVTPATSTICAGNNVTLTATGNTSYSWTPATSLSSPTGSIVIASPTTSTNYTVVGGSGTCTSSAVGSVIISPNPPLIITPSPSSVCAGFSSTIVASGLTSYLWSTGSVSNSISVSPPSTTTYSVIGFNAANGCTVSGFSTLSVIALPIPFANSNGPICEGAALNLNSSGGTSYLWQGPNAFTSNLQNPIISSTFTISMGNYTLNASNNGCTSSTVITVSVIATPTVFVTNNGPLCLGNSLSISSSSGTSHLWTGPNGFTSALSNPTLNNVTLASNGIYSLVLVANGCSVSATTSVQVNALPVVTASNIGPACETKSLTLSGSGGINYLWSGPLGFNSTLQNPIITNLSGLQGGIYSLLVSDANGCKASATTSVTILKNPSVIANGAVVCFGNSASITVSGGLTYMWVGPNGFSSNNANAIIPFVDDVTSGTYNVIVTSANTCTSEAAVNVSTYPLPVPTISVTAKTCINTPVNLIGSPGYLLYQWSGPNNFLSPEAATSFVATSMTQSGIYTLYVTDNRGCTGSATALLTLNQLPNASIFVDNTKKCVPFCSNFSLQNVAATLPLSNLSWNFNGQTFNSSNLNYCITSAGNYLINASYTDANGCKNTSSDTLIAYPIPTAIFEFSPLKPKEMIDEVYFIDGSKGSDINKWSWFFINNSGFQTNAQNPNYIFQNTGTYPVALVVTNKWGCSDTTLRSIYIGEESSFYMPNAFTPNGDGLNDIFLPKAYNSLKFEINIFDRWGQKLFYSNDITAGWDGTFKNLPCKNDVYVWKVTVTMPDDKPKSYTGHVSLIR